MESYWERPGDIARDLRRAADPPKIGKKGAMRTGAFARAEVAEAERKRRKRREADAKRRAEKRAEERAEAKRAQRLEATIQAERRARERIAEDLRRATRDRIQANYRVTDLQDDLRRSRDKLRREQKKSIPKPVRPDQEIVEALPGRLKKVVTEIVKKPDLREGIEAMMERRDEFSTPAAAMLAGVALHPASLDHFDRRIDEIWARESERGTGLGTKSTREVVVGAGLHAAIYCAVRAARGAPEPLVIERSERAGGIFAVSRKPSFWLNSRNRPGDLSLPGRPGSLNFLPGAIVQPADLGSGEFQSNAALAFVIRATLAAYATVTTGRNVRSYARKAVYLDGGRSAFADRIIIATGLNDPRENGWEKSERVVTFAEFMAAMDSPFPLKGMRNVAVIGAGDSGKTAVEALTGKGPDAGMSVVSLDYPESIDWYGLQQTTRGDFEVCNRSRYRGIGSLLNTSNTRPARVRARERAAVVSGGYEVALVNENPYDYVIDCTGFRGRRLGEGVGGTWKLVGSRRVGLSLYGGASDDVLVVGPAAAIGPDATEQVALGAAASLPENATAAFRYAPRTAALAASLRL